MAKDMEYPSYLTHGVYAPKTYALLVCCAVLFVAYAILTR